MKKEEFLAELKLSLKGLRKREIAERIAFYSEMIDDRIEEGLTEEEAVAKIGSIPELTEQTGVKDNNQSKGKLKTTLIIVGSPLWLALIIVVVSVVFSLIVSACAVAISLVVVVWAVLIALWATVLALFVSGIACVLALILYAIFSNPAIGVMYCGVGVFCMGLSVFVFYAVLWLTKKSWILTKGFLGWCKKLIVKRRAKYE